VSFKAVVASSTVRLSASEERVMNVLLGDDMSGIPAAEVAERASTHESTVVRLAKKLGYRGYPDLRNDLRTDESKSEDHEVKIMRAESGYDLSAFVADEIRALKRLPHFVSQEDLDAAARTLHESKTVYLFSRDDEKPTRDLLARRLRRLGLTTVTLGTQPKDLAERFISFDDNSTLIALALREAPGQLATLVSEAARRGGKSILLSDVPGYRFRPSPDHLITARRGDDTEYRTQVIPVVLAYALQLAIFHLDPARYKAARDGIDDLTRLLGGADEIPLRA
jgi:DNA-binding MurR/RpiR family transcriptional regulator